MKKNVLKIPKYFTASVLLLCFMVVSAQTGQAQTLPDRQQDVPKGTDASLNWSGYVADQGDSSYTSVTGTWHVPAVSGTDSSSADATWVGIGGVDTRDLIQAGTQALVDDGQVAYSAWIETLPGYSSVVPLEVQQGDSITATITEQSAGVWLITIYNNSRGTSFSRTVEYDSSLSSAEWVEEMVTNGNGTFRPIDSFGKVSFSDAAATVDGTSKNLSELGAKPLQMVNSAGDALASASEVGADNASFSVARTDSQVLADVPRTTYARRGHLRPGISTITLPLGITITFIESN